MEYFLIKCRNKTLKSYIINSLAKYVKHVEISLKKLSRDTLKIHEPSFTYPPDYLGPFQRLKNA